MRVGFLVVSFFWSLVNKIRRCIHSPNKENISTPVLSIGNIEAGGTGKTPFLIWFLENYLNQIPGECIVLTRGYRSLSEKKGKILEPTDLPIATNLSDLWHLAGDEAVLLQRRFSKIWIGIGANRKEILRTILLRLTDLKKRPGLVILEDGLQQFSFSKDLDVVLESDRPWGTRFFREFTAPTESFRILSKRMNRDRIAVPAEIEWILSPLPSQRYRLVVGIGFPEHLIAQLKQNNVDLGGGIEILRDHDFLDRENCVNRLQIARDLKYNILITEKDAMKWEVFGFRERADFTVLRSTLNWVKGFSDFDSRVRKIIGS